MYALSSIDVHASRENVEYTIPLDVCAPHEHAYTTVDDMHRDAPSQKKNSTGGPPEDPWRTHGGMSRNSLYAAAATSDMWQQGQTALYTQPMEIGAIAVALFLTLCVATDLYAALLFTQVIIVMISFIENTLFVTHGKDAWVRSFQDREMPMSPLFTH